MNTYLNNLDKLKLIKEKISPDAEIFSPLIGGMMNESLIIKDGQKKYVLYVPTEQANEMVNRRLERDNQSIVYSLGITSKNIYFDVVNGVKINEYIEGSSLDKISEFDLKKVAKTLQILHNSPKLSEENYNPFLRFLGYEKEVSEFVDKQHDLYKEIRNLLFKHKDYLESQKLALCHNDAQRSNIIKSVDGKYYLIDFEFMGNNDTIYDIATFGNTSVQEGFDLLNEYAPNPSKDLIKRYYLWRMYISLQWYDVALVKHYRGEGEIHHYNFLDVAAHFLNNANDAYQQFKKI